MYDYNTDNKRSLEELSESCNGLMWLSEADYPWQVISWQNEDKVDRKTLLQQYNYHPETKVVKTTINSFFKPATIVHEWHGEIEEAEAQRYRNLHSWLENNLEDIQVFMVGEVEIDVYILGRLNAKTVAGLSTKVVET